MSHWFVPENKPPPMRITWAWADQPISAKFVMVVATIGGVYVAAMGQEWAARLVGFTVGVTLVLLVLTTSLIWSSVRRRHRKTGLPDVHQEPRP